MTIPKILRFCITAIFLLGGLVFSIVLYNYSQVEVIFDINKLDVDNVSSHPHLTGGPLQFHTPSGSYVNYWPIGKTLVIGCHMHDSFYKTLRAIGCTHWQILSAKKLVIDPETEYRRYALKIRGRIYRIGFSRFEQSLGHGRGIDSVGINWD